MSPSPIYFSIETAIGVIVAQTTAFGNMADKHVESINQKINWILKLSPINPNKDAAILLSSPVSSHETVRIDAPNSKSIVSEA